MFFEIRTIVVQSVFENYAIIHLSITGHVVFNPCCFICHSFKDRYNNDDYQWELIYHISKLFIEFKVANIFFFNYYI